MAKNRVRLGKRERAQRREIFQFIRDTREAVVARNLAGPKPEPSLLSRDETHGLKYNTHTRGISIGQRPYSWQKPGSFKK